MNGANFCFYKVTECAKMDEIGQDLGKFCTFPDET